MKGHMQDGKFHPHTEYKKGTRKSRDQKVKTQGVRFQRTKTRGIEMKNDEEIIMEASNINANSQYIIDRIERRRTKGIHFNIHDLTSTIERQTRTIEKLAERDEVTKPRELFRRDHQPDLGHGTGMFAEFKTKSDFWDYLQEGRNVQRIFEDNSPNTVPKERNTISKVSWKTQSKVGFGSIGQSDDPISYLYKSELKNAVLEPDTVNGGTNVVIHDKDKFTDLRRVYRVWND